MRENCETQFSENAKARGVKADEQRVCEVTAVTIISMFRVSPVMSCCGARNFFQHCRVKISTAATPYASLHLPPAALGNIPTSIRLHIYVVLLNTNDNYINI